MEESGTLVIRAAMALQKWNEGERPGVSEQHKPKTSSDAERPSAPPQFSLVIPAYNEARRIQQTLRAAAAALAELNLRIEIIVVDDGSTDETLAVANAEAAGNHHIHVLGLAHRGKASAVRAGMLAARGDLILFSDADLAVPLSYVREFVTAADGGADIVIASREGAHARRIGEPEYRHVMGRIFNRIVQLLLLPGIEDSQCGFKLFRRSAAQQILNRIRLYGDSDAEVTGARVTAFDVEILVIARRLGFVIRELPVEWTYGEHSKVNPLSDSLFNLRDLATVKWHDLRGAYRSR
jgi:glycosyltransferase involved in cell wall biosynthesis